MLMVAERMKILCPGEIDAHLRDALPRWRQEEGCIRRTYNTHGWKGTLMVANTIGHLAEAAWHHPDLWLSYARVVVNLTSHDAGGVTARDIALAKKIEEVVLWRPGTNAGGALEGTPEDDPRFAYVDYD